MFWSMKFSTGVFKLQQTVRDIIIENTLVVFISFKFITFVPLLDIILIMNVNENLLLRF